MTLTTHRLAGGKGSNACKMFVLEMNLENLVLGVGVGEKAVNSERKQEKAETNRVGRQRAAPKRNLPANHWKSDARQPEREAGSRKVCNGKCDT